MKDLPFERANLRGYLSADAPCFLLSMESKVRMEAFSPLVPLIKVVYFDQSHFPLPPFPIWVQHGGQNFLADDNWERLRELIGGTEKEFQAALLKLSSQTYPTPQPGRMHNRVCVVTGGAQGFGAGIVEALVSQGAIVVIADLNLEKGEMLAVELNQRFSCSRTWFSQLDVTKEKSFHDLAIFLLEEFGGLDLLISNAGILKAGSLEKMPLEDFRRITEVNYIAYFLGIKSLAPLMKEQNRYGGGWCDIIQINSKSGLEGSNKNSAYSGSKFGGIGLTQSFALELVTDRIKVNSICPGNFFEGPLWSDPDKGLFAQYLKAGKVAGAKSVADIKKFYENKVPMGRGCRVEDVMKAMFYIVEQEYETGQAVPVTGGQVMLK